VFRQWRRITSRQKRRAARRIRLNALDNGANFGSLPSRQTRVRIGKKRGRGGGGNVLSLLWDRNFPLPPPPPQRRMPQRWILFVRASRFREAAAIKRARSFDKTSSHEFPATCRRTSTSRGGERRGGKRDTPYRIDETVAENVCSLPISSRGEERSKIRRGWSERNSAFTRRVGLSSLPRDDWNI